VIVRSLYSFVGVGAITNLEVCVGGLLVLPVHGGGCASGAGADTEEQNGGDDHTAHGVPEDLLALTGRSLSAGTVGTESDPVCCANVSEL
jgi:hypothetical protein